jgi:hypothetical protein
MSAMPARVTERPDRPQVRAVPVSRAARRADTRAALKLARRSRRRWRLLSCAILACAFGLTVGILGVLH